MEKQTDKRLIKREPKFHYDFYDKEGMTVRGEIKIKKGMIKIEDVNNKIDFKFCSMNDYLDLILTEGNFNKDDVLNCIHEYGEEIKQSLKELGDK